MSSLTSLLARLSGRRLDVFAAAVGLVVSLALVPLWLVWLHIYVVMIPVVVAGACVLYLVSVRHTRSPRRVPWTIRRLGSVPAQLAGIGLAGLVIAVTLSGERTVPVLLLAGGIGSLILFQIAFLDDEVLDPGPVLVQILALALVVRFAGLFTTPGLIGVDSWTHITDYSASILRATSLAPIADVKYYTAPFYHLTTVIGAQLLGVTLRTALYLVVGGALVLSVLFVYATARYFTTVRWALFATALFAVADHVIRWGLHVIPQSLGLVFFLVVVFYVARLLHAETGWLDLAMLAFFSATVTLTHQVSAFVTLVFLGCGVLAQALVRSPYVDAFAHVDRRAESVITDPVNLLGVFSFHLAFTTLLWAITPLHDSTFLFRVPRLVWLTLKRSAGFLAVAGPSADAAAGAQAPTFVARLAAYVDAAGLFLLLFATVIGSLALLRRHRSPQASYTVIGAVAVMLVFALVLPLLGITTLLPGRWFAFMYALMAVIGAVGLRHVGDRFSSRSVAVGLVVFVLLFPGTMVMAQKATLDNPTFQNQWPKYAYTESELAAVETIGETVPRSADPLYTDHPYRTVFTRTGAHPANTINLTNDSRPQSYYRRIVYRTYQSEGAPQFTAGPDTVVTRRLAGEQVCPPTRNHVYANQNTLLCIRSDA